MRKEFIKLIDAKRRAKGLSRKDLADMLGMSPKQVSLLLNDESVTPRPMTMNKLSEFVGIDLNRATGREALDLATRYTVDIKSDVARVEVFNFDELRVHQNAIPETQKTLYRLAIPYSYVDMARDPFGVKINTDQFISLGIDKGMILFCSKTSVADNPDSSYIVKRVAMNEPVIVSGKEAKSLRFKVLAKIHSVLMIVNNEKEGE